VPVDPLARFPETLEAGGCRYTRRAGCYAVHGPLPPELLRSALHQWPQSGLAVCAGDPPPSLPPAALGAVYESEPGGTPMVPSGRIFVRFAEGHRAEDREAQIASAGYVIQQVPEFAPHAAWVEARSGNIADALLHLSALQALPDMENVEPQVLSPRSAK